MIYTKKIQKAITFAAEAHKKQIRKVSGFSYIIHPLTVSLILARAGADEDTVCAGVLHDVIEDCGVKKEQIQELFGSRVAQFVQSVTEPEKKLSWEERKEWIRMHIGNAGRESLLIKSADMLHNISDLIKEYRREGDRVFEHFGASKEQKVKHYGRMIEELEKAWPENPLFPELKETFEAFRRALGK